MGKIWLASEGGRNSDCKTASVREKVGKETGDNAMGRQGEGDALGLGRFGFV